MKHNLSLCFFLCETQEVEVDVQQDPWVFADSAIFQSGVLAKQHL